MDLMKDLVNLRVFCKENDFPRLPQWQHWITSKHPIAQKCIKKIANRYWVNIVELKKYIESSGLEGHPDETNEEIIEDME